MTEARGNTGNDTVSASSSTTMRSSVSWDNPRRFKDVQIPDVLLALTQRLVGNGDIDRSPARGLDQRTDEHPDIREQVKSKTV